MTQSPIIEANQSFNDALEAFKKYEVFRENMIAALHAAGKPPDTVRAYVKMLTERCNDVRWVLGAHGGVEFMTLEPNDVKGE